MRVAAIDCGTNSVRLLVATTVEGGLRDSVRLMKIVRLGQDVDRTGRLAPEAIERTRVALVGYAELIAAMRVDRVRMVATSASRDAENAADFTAMVRATLGVDPEVVSGDEEARLSFSGAVRGLPADAPAPYLVADIGGGSTEIVLGEALGGEAEVQAAVSVNVGCVRMMERHLRSDPPTAAEIAAAEADITAAVDAGLAVVPGHTAGTLIGLAGSVTTVTAIALGLMSYQPQRIHHARVSYDDVSKVTAFLLGATVEQRLALPVMHPGRADVIGAGALVLRVLMQRLNATSVVASEHDILDGIAWSIR